MPDDIKQYFIEGKNIFFWNFLATTLSDYRRSFNMIDLFKVGATSFN